LLKKSYLIIISNADDFIFNRKLQIMTIGAYVRRKRRRRKKHLVHILLPSVVNTAWLS
jgi:hypothetical protein